MQVSIDRVGVSSRDSDNYGNFIDPEEVEIINIITPTQSSRFLSRYSN